jgi:phage-related holin
MVDFILYFGTWQVQVIVTLIAIDVVLGIIAAFVKRDFTFKKLANFMKGPVLAYIFGFVIVEITGVTFPSLSFIIPASFILIVITILASIFRNLARLGIPVPSGLK